MRRINFAIKINELRVCTLLENSM